MSARPVIAGVVLFAVALFRLLGFFGLFFLSFVEPGIFSHWYMIWVSLPYNFIFAVAFFVVALGLFLGQEWSFKYGIAATAIDIVLSIVLVAFLVLNPGVLPGVMGLRLSTSLAVTGVELIAEAGVVGLIMLSKKELNK